MTQDAQAKGAWELSSDPLYDANLALDTKTAWDAALIAQGAYAPLKGFMASPDYQAVVHTGRLAAGSVWPLPIVLAVPKPVAQAAAVGQVIRLLGPLGFQARMKVVDRFARNVFQEARQVYGTESVNHPGVRQLKSEPDWCLAGPIEILRVPRFPFAEPAWPSQVKALIKRNGWRTVVAFQTRNPLHRAHEALLKLALEHHDGLLLHPLIGPTKADDLSAAVRMKTYRILLTTYFPQDRVLLAVFPAAMRYAGPREALFHALVRKNYGATHFVVGRDAAGVGNFYAEDAARRYVERYAPEAGIEPIGFDRFGYCPVCEGIASSKSCPHADHWITLSGTEMRRRLSAGDTIPAQFLRNEVANILREAYRSQEIDKGGTSWDSTLSS